MPCARIASHTLLGIKFHSPHHLPSPPLLPFSFSPFDPVSLCYRNSSCTPEIRYTDQIRPVDQIVCLTFWIAMVDIDNTWIPIDGAYRNPFHLSCRGGYPYPVAVLYPTSLHPPDESPRRIRLQADSHDSRYSLAWKNCGFLAPVLKIRGYISPIYVPLIPEIVVYRKRFIPSALPVFIKRQRIQLNLPGLRVKRFFPVRLNPWRINTFPFIPSGCSRRS